MRRLQLSAAALRPAADLDRQSHAFVASKAPWFEITDDLPQYPGYPPAD